MKLELIIGPMMGGKSTELLRRLNIYAAMGLRVLYVNHTCDTRGDVFSTHNPMVTTVGNINAKKIKSLEECDPTEFDVLGIDEAQFMKNLYRGVITLVEVHGKKVIVAGLDSDSERNKFGEILDLIPMCDKVDKLAPFCTLCWKNSKTVSRALFSLYLWGKKDVVKIGDSNSYAPVCRSCYLGFSCV